MTSNSQQTLLQLEQLKLSSVAATPSGETERRTERAWLHPAWLLFICTLAAGIALWFWPKAEPLRAITPGVTTALAELPPSDAIQLEVKGFVHIERQAALSSVVSGIVSEVLVQDGQFVQQGQLLVRLDSRVERIQLQRAEHQIELAKIALAKAEQAILREQSKLRRLVGLGDALSRAELEDQQLLLEELELQVAMERQQIRFRENERDAAAVLMAQSEIRAPFAGYIVNLTVQPGEVVAPLSAVGAATRSGIGSLYDLQSLYIKVEVPELYLTRAQIGQQVQIIADAFPQQSLSGTVQRVAIVTNKGMASVDVFIQLNDISTQLLPNMAVNVRWR